MSRVQSFQYPKEQGKYNHPWMKQLPTGRAKLYDVAYMSVTTVLAVAAAYGFFETGRGMYFILKASRERAREANSKLESSGSD